MGGLARRVSYEQAFRKAFPATRVLELNVGYYLNDMAVNVNPPFKYIEVQNTYALRAYSRYPFDAANVSYHDLPLLSPFLKKDQEKVSFAEYPVLKTLISANLTPESDLKSHLAVAPYVIKELKSPRLPHGKLRVAIIGINEPAPATGSGYVWSDPEKVLKDVLPGLKKKADLIVLLAYMPLEKAKALAANCPEIDVVIEGYNMPYQPPMEKAGNASVVVSFTETKLLGELRISFDAKGVASYTNRYVSLDNQVPDEPVAAKLVTEARTAIETAQQQPNQPGH